MVLSNLIIKFNNAQLPVLDRRGYLHVTVFEIRANPADSHQVCNHCNLRSISCVNHTTTAMEQDPKRLEVARSKDELAISNPYPPICVPSAPGAAPETGIHYVAGQDCSGSDPPGGSCSIAKQCNVQIQ